MRTQTLSGWPDPGAELNCPLDQNEIVLHEVRLQHALQGDGIVHVELDQRAASRVRRHRLHGCEVGEPVRGQVQPVAKAGACREVGDGVGACTVGIEERIVAAVADDEVAAGVAVEDVVAGVPEQVVGELVAGCVDIAGAEQRKVLQV